MTKTTEQLRADIAVMDARIKADHAATWFAVGGIEQVLKMLSEPCYRMTETEALAQIAQILTDRRRKMDAVGGK